MGRYMALDCTKLGEASVAFRARRISEIRHADTYCASTDAMSHNLALGHTAAELA